MKKLFYASIFSVLTSACAAPQPTVVDYPFQKSEEYLINKLKQRDYNEIKF